MNDSTAALFKSLNTMEDTINECFKIIKTEHKARTHAETINLQKNEFLLMFAHELRNPMHSILGWLELLRPGKLNEPTARQAIDAIKRGVRRQSKLIEDLLDMSRISNGKLRLNLQEIEAAPVIEDVLTDTKILAEAKQIELEAVFAPSLGNFTVDPYKLEQVLWNLVSNAVKFTPRGGKICVKTERSEFDLKISISDTGRGISAEFLPFVFEPFRQAEHVAGDEREGLGLGLTIVRRIIELHGGSIKADSAGCGQGAVFTIRLPHNATAAEHNQHSHNNAVGVAVTGLF